MTLALLGALAGGLVIGGILLGVFALAGAVAHRPGPARNSALSRWARALRQEQRSERERAVTRVKYGFAVVAGLVVLFFSGWLVGGALVSLAIVGLPALLRPATATTRKIAKLEALEAWTRRLADLRTAVGGLEQALTASLKTVPEPIENEVSTLVARLGAGWRTEDALRRFADDLDEAAADLVVAVLILGAQRRGAGLASVLDDLAGKVAEEVSMRRRVEADRAKPRTTARWVTIITLSVIALSAFNTDYIYPYGSTLGQLVLAVLAAAFVGALLWMRGLAFSKPEPRFLVGHSSAISETAGEVPS